MKVFINTFINVYIKVFLKGNTKGVIYILVINTFINSYIGLKPVKANPPLQGKDEHRNFLNRV
jgi:hypothetical protein